MIKEKLNIAIRVDASKNIGGGHFRRCLTLAKEAKKKGHSVIFISAQLPERDRHLLIKNKILFENIFFEKDENIINDSKKGYKNNCYQKWLKLPVLEDAKRTSKALEKFQPNWIIFDHYGLGIKWVNKIKKNHHMPFYLAIDDLDNRNLGSDFLLDQTSIIDKKRKYKTPGILVGPKFALLSNEFSKYRKKSIKDRLYRQSMALKNKKVCILISLGLYDNKRLLPTLVNALSKKEEINIVVATSSECQTLVELKKIAKKYNNVCLRLDTDNMAKLMLKADICIGASGMSMWERCCIGLPSLTITIAKNQKKITKQTANLNITKKLSIAKTKNQKQLIEAVSNLIYAPKKLQQLSKNSFKTCDGLGTKKVVNFLEATFKKVEISDSKKLLSWRNKKFIRESSLNKKRIHKKNHEIWMEKTQYPKKGIWLIYSEGGTDVGHCNSIYIDKANVSWSFYIGEQKFSPGCGLRMLVFFIKKLFFEEKISTIESKIILDNKKSKKIHRDLGFILTSTNEHFENYILTKDTFQKRFYSNIV
ncbi:MAG: UDP-2,4-diacetamido-2,4,6-trideoxy-beta-L-altropyranose hydrolase [Paracoccaceae bacterium]